MKNTYQILYIIAAVIFIIVLLGGSLTRPIFNSFSEKSLNTMGISRQSIDSVDNSIDEMLYKIDRVNLQIEKLKNLFSDDKIDESGYNKTRHEIIYKNVYSPINNVIISIYRTVFLLISIIFLFAGIISHLVYRASDLRRRVTLLEEKISVYQN